MSFNGEICRETCSLPLTIDHIQVLLFFSRMFLKIFWILIYLSKDHLIFWSLSVVGKCYLGLFHWPIGMGVTR